MKEANKSSHAPSARRLDSRKGYLISDSKPGPVSKPGKSHYITLTQPPSEGGKTTKIAGR